MGSHVPDAVRVPVHPPLEPVPGFADLDVVPLGARAPPGADAGPGDRRKAGRCIDEWAEAGDTRIFMLKCTCGSHDSPWNVWEKFEFMDAPPAVYKDGWGYFRLVTFNEGGTKALFKDFGKRGPTELIRKRELSLQVLPTSIWVNSLFAEMTQKQVDALLKAHRYGYYTSPRQITTENVANSLGVARSTYEEHLRKAENRIMEALVPYLQLYVTGEKDAEKLPSRGTPDVASQAEA